MQGVAKEGSTSSRAVSKSNRLSSPFLTLDGTSCNALNILHSLGHSVHCFSLTGDIIYWNAAAENLYGHRAEEVIGLDVVNLLCLESDFRVAEAIIARQAGGDSWSGGFKLRKQNGAVFNAFCTNTPLRSNAGKIVGVISTVCSAQEIFEQSAVTGPSHPLPSEGGMSLRHPLTGAQHCGTVDIETELERHHSWFTSITSSAMHLLGNVPLRSVSTSSDRLAALFGSGKLASVWGWGRRQAVGTLEKAGSNMSITSISSSEADEYRIISCQSCRTGESCCHANGGCWSEDVPSPSTSIEENVDLSIEAVRKSVNNMSTSCCISLEDLELKENIGEGSFANVYHAVWNGSHVAVKMFIRQEVTEALLENFSKEVSIMKSARHPSILLYMGIVASKSELGIVTEFMPRGSLYRVLHKTRQPIDFTRRLCMALDVVIGMNYLHKCRPAILHRDLKSSNLLVDRHWNVKIGDFGLSKFKNSLQASGRSMKGTPQWMAPEVLLGETADEKSDVYSFGVILWELCTRKKPWAGLSAVQVVGAVAYQDRELEIPSDLHSPVSSILKRCLARDPSARPHFVDLVEALRLLLKNEKNGL